MMKTIIKYFKETIKEFIREREDRIFQDGFEFAMSMYYLYSRPVSEIAEKISKKPDSFDMGILYAIRMINKEG